MTVPLCLHLDTLASCPARSQQNMFSFQVTLVKDNIMPRLINLSRVDDEGVAADVSRSYASISSNAQCQASIPFDEKVPSFAVP